MSHPNSRVSMIIPTFNEVLNLPILIKEIEGLRATLLQKSGLELEVIFVDNNSLDGSSKLFRELANQSDWIKIVRHKYNRGLQQSIRTGIVHSSGGAVLVYQSDMQDPLELIPLLFDHWRSGAKYVATKIIKRNSGLVDGLVRSLGYLILRFFSRVKLISNSTDFWLIDAELGKSVLLSTNIRTFFRMDLLEICMPDIVIPYERSKRSNGYSNFNFALKYEFFLDALLSDIRKYLTNVVLLITLSIFALISSVVLKLSVFNTSSYFQQLNQVSVYLFSTLLALSVLSIMFLNLEMTQRIYKQPFRDFSHYDIHYLPANGESTCKELTCYSYLN
jgi:glycosyltransferase involved in cell wall biosynthesis